MPSVAKATDGAAPKTRKTLGTQNVAENGEGRNDEASQKETCEIFTHGFLPLG
jgi:hypothetical protein